MNEAAIAIQENEAAVEVATVEQSYSEPDAMVIALGIGLILMQVADGILTGIGVMRFGAEMEGNMILRSLMHQFDPILVLAGVKMLAIGVIFSLCRLAATINWIKPALTAIASLYLFAAIIPWCYLLLR